MKAANHLERTTQGSPDRPSAWRRRLIWALAPSLVLVLVSSCGLARKTRSAFATKVRMEVLVLPAINRNSPVAVELLMIRNRSLWDKLREKPAAEWFEERDAFARTFPDGFQSWRWEWVPGQPVPPQTLEVGRGVKWGVVFARYLVSGDHRAVIKPREPFRLVLDKTAVRVEPL
jgi:hypothetical protein